MEHFGVKVQTGKYGLELTRENFAVMDKQKRNEVVYANIAQMSINSVKKILS